MENEARYILVGSLIITVSLMLVASLIWLSGGERIAYQHYTIYFRNQSMDGLDISSPVKMRGIKIGEVSDFSFVTGGHNAVKVNVKIEPNTPVHVDSRATVQRNILTGMASIDIGNPNPNSPLQVNQDQESPWPIIAEGSSDLQKVTTNLTQMTIKSARVLDNINQMLDKPNRDALAATLNNLQTLSASLVAHKHVLDETFANINHAAQAMTMAADHISQTSNQANVSLVNLTQQANQTLSHTNAMLGSLQQQSVVLSQHLQQLTDTARTQLKQVGDDVHQSTGVVSGIGQRFNQPASLIFGSGRDEPAPGE